MGAEIEGPASGRDTLVGSTLLGQFTLQQRIGAGGFGAVYLAEQIGLGRKAVVKISHPSLARDPVFQQRFQREAKVLASLDHHHLVKLYNYGELPSGQTFLVMEYGGDRTLADEIRQVGRLPVARALRICEQICDALSEAHNRGIVHRDLKPANILLGRKDDDEWVKVVDVGIAKLLEKRAEKPIASETLTAFGEIVGTPAYFSPEQARGLAVDARSDIYSLGVVLYEALTGKLPITASTPVDYVRAHAVEAPTPMSVHGVELPQVIETLVYKALEKNPAKRFQSAREFRDALIRAPDAAAVSVSAVLRSNGMRLPRRSRTPILIVVGVVALAGIAASVWLVRGSSGSDPQGERPAPPAWARVAPAPAKVSSPAAVAPPAAPAHPTPAAAPASAPAAAPSSALVPPGSLLVRSPSADLKIGIDGSTPRSADGPVRLERDAGEIEIASSDGKWSLRATYQRTASATALELLPASGTDVREPEGGGHLNVTDSPQRVVLVNRRSEELPLLLLYQAKPSE
jgi:serine/threonine-protein kinase